MKITREYVQDLRRALLASQIELNNVKVQNDQLLKRNKELDKRASVLHIQLRDVMNASDIKPTSFNVSTSCGNNCNVNDLKQLVMEILEKIEQDKQAKCCGQKC